MGRAASGPVKQGGDGDRYASSQQNPGDAFGQTEHDGFAEELAQDVARAQFFLPRAGGSDIFPNEDGV